MFKKDVEVLVRLGVLEHANDFEWVSSYFPHLKGKNNWVRSLSDFWNLNKQLKRKSYPLPKICEMLLKLEVFKYATSLDLNMGYYHIRSIKEASNLCNIIFSRGNYWYKCLLMGVSNFPDIFYENMNKIFCGFEFIRE